MSESVPQKSSRDKKMKVKANEPITIHEDDGPTLDLRLSLSYPHAEKKEAEVPKRRWLCVHCGNDFDSPHALGGHQNGHKSERAKMASEKLLKMPIHTPLGIDRAAMVHKPSRERHVMPRSYLYQPSTAQPWPSTAELLQDFGIMNYSPSVSSDRAKRSEHGGSKKDGPTRDGSSSDS